jgi:hypothetical protein
MEKFELLSLDQTKLVEDFSADVEISGKVYEVAVRYINFMDGSCEYHVNGRVLPVDDATLHAITEAVIKQHNLMCAEDEGGENGRA